MNKKTGIIIGVALLAVVAAAGTVIGIRSGKKKAPVSTQASVSVSENAQETQAAETSENAIKAYSDGAQYGSNLEGSAIYPEGTTVIVTITASAGSDKWDDKSLKTAEKKLQTALDFISSQAKEKYGKTVTFVSGKDDLVYDYTYTGSDDIGQMVYDDYNGLLNDFVKSKINAGDIRSKYKADGIAYVYLLDGTGENTASVHLADDDSYTYNEAAYIYRYDYNSDEGKECSPAQYAHEILKLFGAVDLTAPDAQNGYTTALDNVVRSEYSNDIMFTTLDSEMVEDQDKIDNEITDITAYAIGLTDKFAELDDNKSFTKKYRCGFVDSLAANTKDGKDYSEYEDDPAWAEAADTGTSGTDDNAYSDDKTVSDDTATDEYTDEATTDYSDYTDDSYYSDDTTDDEWTTDSGDGDTTDSD